MTSKPNKPIMLFDCKTSQNIIGQDKFLKAFENILNHGAYCQGPETKELDEKLAAYSGVKYCSTCGSGTDALTLALMAWGVKEGDAVFVSSFTFVGFAGRNPDFRGFRSRHLQYGSERPAARDRPG